MQIGQNAFLRTNNIIKATIGNNVESLGKMSFAAMTNLTSIVIGENVNSIGTSTFNDNNKIQTITFRCSTIPSLSGTYNGLTSWTEIKLDGNEENYKVEDNILYSKDGKKLIVCPGGKTGEITIPNMVEEIGDGAFGNCRKITSVIISDNVKKIGKTSFAGMNNLTSIVIGKNVNSIGASAFNDNNKIQTITFKCTTIPSLSGTYNGLTGWTEIKLNGNEDNYKIEDNILYSKDGKKLIVCPGGKTGEITIPNMVEEIGDGAFINCRKITSIIVSDNVKKIGKTSFAAMNNLTSIVIGKNVNSIGISAFNDNSKLKTVTMDSQTVASGLTAKTSMSNLINNATTIYIKSDIGTIGSYVTSNYTLTTSDKEGYVKYVK